MNKCNCNICQKVRTLGARRCSSTECWTAVEHELNAIIKEQNENK